MAGGFLSVRSVRDKSCFFYSHEISCFAFDFRTSIPCKEKSPGHFKDLYKLKLLKSFDVNI